MGETVALGKVANFAKHVLACADYGYRRLAPRRSGLSIKILLHHKVGPVDHLGLSVPPDLFDREAAFLADNFPVISLGEAVHKIRDAEATGEYVVLTFDDGYLDNFTNAFPILESYHIPMTVFVTTGGLNSGMLHWDLLDTAILRCGDRADCLSLDAHGLPGIGLGGREQKEESIRVLHRELKSRPDAECRCVIEHILAELGRPEDRLMLDRDSLARFAASPLVTIGSHTVSHPVLSRVDREQARREVTESKLELERITGKDVRFFAYPNGTRADYDTGTIRLLQEAGYEAACTTHYGENRPGAELFELQRMDVTMNVLTRGNGSFSKTRFAAHLSGIFDKLKRMVP